MAEEYGGYLPFEFIEGNEYYQGKDVIALNCARNAIVYAVRDAQYKKLWIPFYMCESIRQTLVAKASWKNAGTGKKNTADVLLNS